MTSLRTKLSAWTLTTLLIGFLLTGMTVLDGEFEQLREDVQADGRTLARTVAAMCVEPVLVRDVPVIETHLRAALESGSSIRSIEVFDAVGRSLARETRSTEAGTAIESFVFQSPVEMVVPPDTRDVVGNVRVVLVGERLRTLTTATLRRFVIGGLTSFLGLALVLTWVLHRHVLRPVAKLDAKVAALSAGDLDAPIQLDSKDELGRFADALNSMRARLKESLRQIEEQVDDLRELDKTKDRLLTNMSHELRTPISGILGLAELCLDDDTSDGERRDLLGQIRESTVGLVTRVDLLIDAASLESGSVVCDVQSTSIAEDLERWLPFWVERATNRGLLLDVRLSPEFRAAIGRTDPNHVRRVLESLLSNAVRFTEKGAVVLTAEVVLNDTEARWIRLRVTDTGPGIAEEDQDSIFEPFFQSDMSPTRKHDGMGLGLSLAHRLAVLLGGQLTLTSEPGHGSTFTNLLPFPAEAAESRQACEPQPTSVA